MMVEFVVVTPLFPARGAVVMTAPFGSVVADGKFDVVLRVTGTRATGTQLAGAAPVKTLCTRPLRTQKATLVPVAEFTHVKP